ncbi:MAG: glycosyltransferase, partial [Cytophagales bacterium]|nr:glycosyltransferase [Cytophaga sp.]
MRILILSTFDTFGGAAIAAMRLHKAFLKQGAESKMLVQEKKSTVQNVSGLDTTWFQKKKTLIRFALDRLEFALHEKNKQVRFGYSQASFGVDISKHVLVEQADVIHIHWVHFGFLSITTLEKLIATKKPIVITMHDMWFFTGGCHYSKNCLHYTHECGNCEPYVKRPSADDISHTGWLRKKQLLNTGTITFVACSEWLADTARTSTLLGDKKVLSVPNPIDVGLFHPIEKHNAQEFFNLSPNKYYVLFAAMKVTDERKGFAYLKEALELLLKAHPEVQDTIELLIFGQEDTTEMESIPFKVTSLGRLSDASVIAKAYAAANLFVIPSLEDNLPNTVMEAMSCGT